MALPKLLESTARVRFHDCDPFNHLNNSRYIDYIVAAREDQLLTYYNFDVYKLLQEQYIGWVSAQTQVSYIAPALLMEELTIQTCLLHYSSKSLLLEATVWNSGKSLLKAVLWMKLVHFNLATQRSHEHTNDLMHLFEQIVAPMEIAVDFDMRVRSLKTITP